MQEFDFLPTTRVVFGNDSIQKLGTLSKELGATRALLVSDTGLIAAGHVQAALNSLHAASIETFLFSDFSENPTTSMVETGTSYAKECGNIDLIIGLGGGSSMDTARGINFLLTNGGRMEDYWGFNKASRPMLPSIGIPTTAGTGSDAQSYALISQEKTHTKMACGDVKARFRIVILDPVLSISCPRSVTAISGIDAITHAIETFVSTRSNPFSETFSKEAWGLLDRNYERVLNAPEDREARGAMLLGSHLAGLAIENSMLGAAHACANPLTAQYNIAHGIAVSLMLPHVIQFNTPVVSGGYETLLKISHMNSGTDSPTLSQRIRELQTAGALPQRLRDSGVNKERLQTLANEANSQWTGEFNPRPLTEQDFFHLYESAY